MQILLRCNLDVDAWIQSSGVGNMKVSISLEMLHLFLRPYPDALKSTHLLSVIHLRVPYVEETRELLSEEQTHGRSGHLFGGLENALSWLHFHCWDKPLRLRWLIKEIISLGSWLQRGRRWSPSRETEGITGNAFVLWNLRVHSCDTPPTWPHFLILLLIGAWIFKHMSHGAFLIQTITLISKVLKCLIVTWWWERFDNFWVSLITNVPSKHTWLSLTSASLSLRTVRLLCHPSTYRDKIWQAAIM